MVGKVEPNQIPLDIKIIITFRNQQPCIELRRCTTDIDIIKSIISCAFHNRPIIVQPTFTNELKSLSSLVDKGILYYNEENKTYHFTL